MSHLILGVQKSWCLDSPTQGKFYWVDSELVLEGPEGSIQRNLMPPSPHAENQDCFQLFISYKHSDVSFMKYGFPEAFEI